ncbi:hypothetical protein FA13DRAFT_1743458 [Coprinellus micaceus]|uniref:DUF6533 domain-containing protein n=1 Tax=Coprinellus micaceus TaxID=71717 RepID=A0A4Y7SE54_COPMI|nr:hypothetical protein FA13DRAFT_1743458 [Coprinellus micaceus]
MALLYHYATTFDEEVKYIWPQPTWKLGKILFLTARYASILSIISDWATSTPNFADISVVGCQVGLYASNLTGMVSRMAAEGTLWLCLYALLEGKARYLYLLIVGFLCFTIPAQVLQSFYIFSPKAITPSLMDNIVGWPCNFGPVRHQSYYAIATYLTFTRALLAALVGFVTISIRYRKQDHSLIRVIRREGGMYYISALVLLFAVALVSTPGIPVKDKYSIVGPLRLVLINVFVERLILRMKNVDDPGTQACISSLMFNRPAPGSGSDASEDISEAFSEASPLERRASSEEKSIA